MKSGLLFAVALLALACAAQLNPQNVPEDVHLCLERNSLLAKYEFSARVNPFYLRGDFDGDGKPDYAAAITDKTAARKAGVLMCRSSTPQAQVLGAGTDFAGEDIFDFDAWEVHPKGKVREGASGPPPALAGEFIVIQLDETANGIIFWDEKKYAWYALAE